MRVLGRYVGHGVKLNPAIQSTLYKKTHVKLGCYKGSALDAKLLMGLR